MRETTDPLSCYPIVRAGDGAAWGCLRHGSRAVGHLRSAAPCRCAPLGRADARRSGVKEVRLDVRALGFISSSCFKPLVTWLAVLRERADEERHEIATHTQPERQSLKRGMVALVPFGAGSVEW